MNAVKKYILWVLITVVTVATLPAQQRFTSLDEVLVVAKQRSTTLKSGEIRHTQAQKAQLAAIANIADLAGNVSLNVTNNTQLPVSLFPAEAFGGAPGTYREVQTGIQYTNNFNQYVEGKLLNVSGWKSWQLAKINVEATQIDQRMAEKTLYENIAATYYNILTLQAQSESTAANAKSMDTLLQIVKAKFDLGLARQQEVNDAQANALQTEALAASIGYLIAQQYIALKILCDIPENESITIAAPVSSNLGNRRLAAERNRLSVMSNEWKERSAWSSYQQQKLQLLPTVSAFVSNAHQQFASEFSLLDGNVRWINSNYIGLKATWMIPSANTVSQISKTKFDYLLAKENTAHANLQTDLEREQLEIDLEKGQAQMRSNQQIHVLRRQTYQMNLANYQAGILGLDQLLNSYNAMVNSNYDRIAATVTVLLAAAKIELNNEIQ
jgi:outer membrane protein TolC